MSFTNYMRQKTYENIEKTVYNDKIRQKESFLEKFQSFLRRSGGDFRKYLRTLSWSLGSKLKKGRVVLE